MLHLKMKHFHKSPTYEKCVPAERLVKKHRLLVLVPVMSSVKRNETFMAMTAFTRT